MTRAITLEFYPPFHEQSGWTVREGDRYIDRLTWDEMLGQVATLTHPRLKGESLFGGMLTAEEHAARDAERRNRRRAAERTQSAKQESPDAR